MERSAGALGVSGKVTQESVDALALALGAPVPYAAAAAFVAGLAADAWAPPDPLGTVRIFGEGA